MWSVKHDSDIHSELKLMFSDHAKKEKAAFWAAVAI